MLVYSITNQDDLHQVHDKKSSLSGPVLQDDSDGQKVGVVEVQHVSALDKGVWVGERETGLLLTLQAEGQTPQEEERPDGFPRFLHLSTGESLSERLSV